MRRIILMALTALTLTGGAALADRDHRRWNDRSERRWGDRSDRRWDDRNSSRDRDRAWDRRGWRDRDRNVVWHDHGRYGSYRVLHAHRTRPSFRNGRFYFSGGFYRTYSRPVINYRYTNYHSQPRPLNEQYDTVPGYNWVAGQWQWNGSEWTWTNGYYDVDASYDDNTSDSGSYSTSHHCDDGHCDDNDDEVDNADCDQDHDDAVGNQSYDYDYNRSY